jgi:Cu2+-exporting ATPase
MGDAVAGAGRGACAHCGLAAPAGETWCCYGCELAAQIAAEGRERQTALKATLVFSLLLSMLVMMISLLLFSDDVYGAGSAGGARLQGALRVVAAAIATPVIWMLGVPLLRRALRQLRAGRLSMELLVGIGALAAYAVSIAAIARGRGGVYFDSATAALLLVTLGRTLEAGARARASRLIGPQLDLAAEPVEVVGQGMVAPAAIAPGARLRVPIERVVPVDATLAGEGPAAVNLAILTGEAAPVTLRPGDRVPAGAVPVASAIECVAVTSSRESTLARLEGLARSLRERRPGVLRLADRFAAALTPIVVAIAATTAIYWTLAASVDQGVEVALAVVLVACPCTYGVSTPLILWLALRRALERGVLIRDAAAIEALAGVRRVAFDKTGTLTERELSVERVELAGAERHEALALAAGLEQGTRHPVGLALAAAARAEGVKPAAVSRVRADAGRGVQGLDAAGRTVAIGASSWLDPLGPRGAVVLARGGEPIARFHLAETLRPEAGEAVAALSARGIGAFVLSGDTAERAEAVASTLGLAAVSRLAAADKVARLGPDVAMVGDGLNDAPALAAGPGFAMGSGTGLARGVAPITLLERDLRLVPWTLELARRSVRTVRRNLAWSSIYNLVFLGMAAAGALRPVWAGVAMLVASLVTLASAWRFQAVRS